MMAERPEKFNMDEMRNYFSLVDNLSVDVSDKLIADIKIDIENKILNSNIRLKTEDCKEFFDVDIDYKNKTVTWKNTDKFTFGRAVLYFKKLISVSTSGRGINSLRQSVLCFGKATTNDPVTSNANIEYINKLCDDAGILLISPSTPQPVATASASTLPSRQERIANPTNRDDVLPKAPKAKQADKAKAATPIQTDAPKTPAQEPPQEPVIGTPFLSHGFNFLLLKPSEAFQRPDRKAIIDGYLFEDTVSFFFGPASSYKTFWLLWEAIHIATGKEFCGMKINGGARRILFITLEMTAKDITNRMYRMTANWTADEKKLLDENFILLSSEDESRIRATSTKILEALMEMCDQNNIGGIYLDAYTEYIVGLDVRSESQGDVINAMRQKANKHHVFFRVIHHSTKTTKTKDGDIDGSMAGIHTIRDTADQVYAVKLLNENLEIRITNDPTKDNSTKPRFGKAITFTVKFISDEERGSFSFARLENNETSSYIEKYSNLLSAIEEEPGIPKGKLRDKLGNPKDLTKMIQNAVDAGDIIVDSKKSDKGQTQQCLYRSEYWNNTH